MWVKLWSYHVLIMTLVKSSTCPEPQLPLLYHDVFVGVVTVENSTEMGTIFRK